MTPNASRWRSSASYDHVEDLTASHLAWEWLRRNDAYDKDFEALMQAGADPQSLTDKIRQQWGLRFPCRPSAVPADSADLLAPTRRYQRRCPRGRACRSGDGR